MTATPWPVNVADMLHLLRQDPEHGRLHLEESPRVCRTNSIYPSMQDLLMCCACCSSIRSTPGSTCKKRQALGRVGSLINLYTLACMTH